MLGAQARKKNVSKMHNFCIIHLYLKILYIFKRKTMGTYELDKQFKNIIDHVNLSKNKAKASDPKYWTVH